MQTGQRDSSAPSSSALRRCTLPLLVPLVLQCLVVVLSVTAVILLLTIQQRQDYEEVVHSNLRLLEESSRSEYLTPILEKEKLMDVFENDLVYNPHRKGILYHNTTSFDDIIDFYNGAMDILRVSPRVSSISMTLRNEEDVVTSPITGAPTAYFRLALATRSTILLSINSTYTLVGTLVNGNSNSGPNVGFPLASLDTPSAGLNIVELHNVFNSLLYSDPHSPRHSAREWDQSIVNILSINDALIRSYAVSLATTPRSQAANSTDYRGHGFRLTMDLTTLTPIVLASVVAPSSVICLVSNRDHRVLLGRMPFTAIDAATNESHVLPFTPDTILNQAFIELDALCGANYESSCNYSTFHLHVDGVQYVVSAVRVRTDDTEFNQFIMQYTPYEYLFGRFDERRKIGVAVGVITTVLIVICCILIWFAMVVPINHLQDQMAQASVMHNQEAADAAEAHGGSVLREMDTLHRSFVAMNQKLLEARPYLPQALLLSTDNDGVDEPATGSGDIGAAESTDDEGDLVWERSKHYYDFLLLGA